MKKALIRALTLALSMIFSLSLLPAPTLASTNQNGNIAVDFSVKERNGIAVEDYFFRRGIAFEKGLLYSPDDICLSENGKPLVSDAEVLETYSDGSIRWLLISGIVDLRPGELKRLLVTNGNGPKGTASAEATTDGLTVETKNISLKIGGAGIESIKKNGVELLTSGSINLYVTFGGDTAQMKADEFRVLKNTDAYVKVAFSGSINSETTGEFYITIPEGSDRIQIDHRVTSKNHITMESMGLIIGMKCYDKAVGEIVDDDVLDLGNIELSTYDNTRFNGAVNAKENTGYIIDEDSVRFAPIINNAEYTYWDGLTRTAHLYLCTEGGGATWAKTLSYPPRVFADPQQYVKAGEILSAEVGAYVGEFQESIKKGYEKSLGYFEAGRLMSYNEITEGASASYNIPGEVEYNYGIIYMQTGDEEIYRQMFDISELRSDIAVYRGMHEDVHGIMRARIDMFAGGAFFHSHAYYSDDGGLYMAYLLTGDEWVYDSYKLCINKTYKDMYERPTLGTFHVDYTYLNSTNAAQLPTNTIMMESRGMIRARTMYLAGRHFHNEKFTRAAEDIVKWAKTAQLADGDYSQAYFHEGPPMFQAIPEGRVKQLPIKNYVNLMGFRGVSQMLDFEEYKDNKELLEIVCKYADQLCYQGENFGAILMNPTGDKNKYEVNEDDTRTTDGRANILAVDVLCTAFENTGDEKYLLWILKFLEAAVGSSVGGTAGMMNDKGYGLGGWGTEIQRMTSLFRTSDNLSVLFRDYRDRIAELGYEHVAIAFSPTADSYGNVTECNLDYPNITHNLYEKDGTRALFAMTWRPPTGENDVNACWEQDVEFTVDSNRLWTGIENSITNPYRVVLKKRMDFAQELGSLETQINLAEFSGNAVANVLSYTPEKVEFTLDGEFEADIQLKDGVFQIKDGNGYDVKVISTDTGIKVVVMPGGATYPEDGIIRFVVDNKGNKLDAVGLKLFDNTKAANKAFDAALSREELISIVREKLGCEISLKSEYPTWQEFSAELITALGAIDSDILSKSGIYTLYEAIENPDVNDETAVNLAAQNLEIVYDAPKLSSNVYLAKNSIHGTTVKWTSSREDILSTEGVLTRDNIDCDTIKLKAEISRGKAVKTKEFTIPLDRTPPEPLVSNPTYDTRTSMAGLIKQTGKFEFTFEATPMVDTIDCVLSISSSDINVTSNSDPQYRVRFASTGYIDTYDAIIYKSESKIKWNKGTTYVFRMVVDLETETFDAFVAPKGGKEVQIAKNYARRTGAKSVDNINQFWTWSRTTGEVVVDNISIFTLKNTPEADVYITDFAGKKFGPGQPLGDYTFANRTNDSRFINWQSVTGTALDEHGQRVKVHLGIKRLAEEKLSLTEVLKACELIPQTTVENSKVTKTSLTRILGNR